jgi:phosphopantetheinyl transferase (holo-ACP synthase)
MTEIYAAKGAVVKAVDTGFKGFSPCAIEIIRDGRGVLSTMLHKSASEFVNNVYINTSMLEPKIFIFKNRRKRRIFISNLRFVIR